MIMTNTKRRFQVRTFNGRWICSMNDETKAREAFERYAATTIGAQLIDNGVVVAGPARSL